VLSFERSADVLVMLILGGTGRLYGGLLGATLYLVARDQFSGANPQFWYFWIGLLLVVVVSLRPYDWRELRERLPRALAARLRGRAQ